MVSGVHTSFLHSAYPPLPGHQPPTPGPPPRTPYPCKSVGVPSAQGGCHPHLGALPILALSRSLLQERLWLERGYLLPRAPSADTRQGGRFAGKTTGFGGSTAGCLAGRVSSACGLTRQGLRWGGRALATRVHGLAALGVPRGPPDPPTSPCPESWRPPALVSDNQGRPPRNTTKFCA